MLDLSVIVCTHNRQQLLHHCLRQYKQQVHNLSTEILVVCDGPNPFAPITAAYYEARYIELKKNYNDFGATPRNVGLEASLGKYVVFWNDDNIYYPNALDQLYSAANNYDIGVCQCIHWINGIRYITIPPPTSFTNFRYGEIDAMNFCIKREVALLERWRTEPKVFECDLRYLEDLNKHLPTVNFYPVIIGEHI